MEKAKRIIICLLFLALSTLLIARGAFADTLVGGNMYNNATWTAAGSPYVVQNSVVIDSSATLTIEAGVTVRFNPGTFIRVQYGAVRAMGTAASPVTLTSWADAPGGSPAPGGWNGIAFMDNANDGATVFNNTIIRYGSTLTMEAASPTFNNCVFDSNAGYVMSIDLASYPHGAGNGAVNNGVDAISVASGDMTASGAWDLKGIPYYLTGVVSVGVSPRVTGMSPSYLEQGSAVNAVITGTRLAGLSKVTFADAGITASVLPGGTDASVPVLVTVGGAVPYGTAGFTVAVSAGVAASPNPVTITPAMPHITSVTPAQALVGQPGTNVTITGANFSPSSVVTYDVVTISSTYVSPTEIQAVIPLQTVTSSTKAIKVANPDPRTSGATLVSNAFVVPVALPQFTVTPSTVAMRQGETASIAVSIPYPAPAGGLTVMLTSTNTSVLTAPASVVIAEGTQSANVTLTALSTVNTRNVTLEVHANANNWTGAIATVTVMPQPTVNLIPTTLLTGVGYVNIITVELTDPAPAGGVTVVLGATVANIISHPATVTIAVGATRAQFNVSTYNAGSTTLAASVSGYATGDSCAITVKPVEMIPIGPVTSSEVGVTLTPPAPAAAASAYGPVGSAPVGVVLGSAVTGIAPDRGIIGAQGLVVRVNGIGLGTATDIAFAPADGITVVAGSFVKAGDGSYAEVTVNIDANAPTGVRAVSISAPGGSIKGAASFYVTWPLPEILSVIPIYGVDGATIDLNLHGGNFKEALSISFTPSDGITVENPPTINADGSMAVSTIVIAADAATGPRLVRITTMGGTSTDVASVANTFNVWATQGTTYTPVVSGEVGVYMMTPAPSAPQVTYTPIDAQPVGVAVGAAFTGLSPAHGEVNSAAYAVRASGAGLGAVNGVSFMPSDGITVAPGSIVPAADGTYVDFQIDIAGDAPLGTRTVVVTTASGAVLPGATGANLFFVSMPPPVLTGMNPISKAQGATFTLTLIGANFNYASAVAFTPPTGVSIQNPPAVNAAGTIATVTVSIDAGAATSTRVVTLTTPGGTTSAIAGAANTFYLSPGETYTPQVSAEVGVYVTPPAPGAVVNTYGPAASTEVGVYLTPPPPQATTVSNAYGPIVTGETGVAVGPIVASISPTYINPGTTVTFTLTGYGLENVGRFEVYPADGITVVNWTAAPDGRSATVTLVADAAMPTGYKTIIPFSMWADTTPPMAVLDTTGGTYAMPQKVTITADEPSTIYYTLDGGTPTSASLVYTRPIDITTNTTLKYYAVDAANNPSAVQTEAFNITGSAVVAWGANWYGQLGDGTTTDRHTPEQGGYGISGVVALAGGSYHTLALKNDGTVWAWGYNSKGQLGDGTYAASYTPVQVSNLTGVVAISAGLYHSVALRNDGTVWCWGYGYYGQLGNGGSGSQNVPVQASGPGNVTAVSAGHYHTIALTGNGDVYGWGYNYYGQAGDGSGGSYNKYKYAPVKSAVTGAVSIGTSGYHSLAVLASGEVRGWGYNPYGQLGDGTTTTSYAPVAAAGITNAVSVKAGLTSSAALLSDGTVWTWGYNRYGDLGDGTYNNRYTPGQVPGLAGVTMIGSGEDHYIAVDNNGAVWAWGNNGDGEMGDGTTTHRGSPWQVAGITGATGVFGGRYHSMALAPDAFAPIVTASKAAGAYTVGPSATVDVALTANEPATVYYTTDGTVPTTGSAVYSGVISMNAATTLQYFAVDAAGNAGGVETLVYTIVVDAAPPVVTPSVGAGVYTAPQHVTLSANEAATIYYTADGTEPTTASAQYGGVPFYIAGTTTLKYFAVDGFGNAGPVVTQVYEVIVSVAAASESFESGGLAALPWGASGDGQWTVQSGAVYNGTYAAQSPALLDNQSASMAITTQTAAGSVTFWYSTDSQSGGDYLNFYIDEAIQGSWSGTIAWTQAAFTVSAGSHTFRWEYSKNSCCTSGQDRVWIDDIVFPAAADTFAPYVSASPAGGSYAVASGGTKSVTLGANEPAVIYYTADGTAPTTASTVYAGPVVISADTTLKYFAVDTAGNQGAVATDVYALVVDNTPPSVTASASGGTYGGPRKVTFTTDEPAAVYYTLDASAPSASSLSVVQGVPVYVAADATLRFIAVDLAGNASAAQSTNLAFIGRSVMTWGANWSGQLGDGTYNSASTPVNIGFSGATQADGGSDHTAVLRNDGTVWSWGDNGYGQLGNGTTASSLTPVQASGLTGVIAVATGGNHTLALRNDGTVWAWGYNNYGQLGDGTNINRSAPVQVLGLSNVVAISGGWEYSMSLRGDGTVWAWGYNNYGQLGDGTNTTRYAPVRVPNLSGVAGVTASWNHSLALMSDGTVRAWGSNNNGQLGDGTYANSLVPVVVNNLSGVVALASGDDPNSIALLGDGTVRTWGASWNGDLGNGTNTGSPVTVQPAGVSGIISVAMGWDHSLTLKNDGTILAWGYNSDGELGDGTTIDRWSAVQVSGITAAGGVVGAGGDHSIALVVDVTPPTTTASPVGGAYGAAQAVTLTANEPAAIYYTTDGSTPNTTGDGTIAVQSGTYGANCGTGTGNVTPHLSSTCDGLTTCSYYITTGSIGDPAVGCAKDYAAAWTCSPSGQVFTATASAEAAGQTITLSCAGAGTTAVYSAPISIASSATLKFYAVDAVGNAETVKTETYAIGLAALPWAVASADNGRRDVVDGSVQAALYSGDGDGPATFMRAGGLDVMSKYEARIRRVVLDTTPPVTTASPAGGAYAAPQRVALTADEPATIYYTTDGSTPTPASAVYAGPINVLASATLNYFAVDAAGNIEAVNTQTYSVNIPMGGFRVPAAPFANVIYGGPAPSIISVQPIISAAGSTFTLTINGTALNDATAVSFIPPDGMNVSSTITVNAAGTQAAVQVHIDGFATGGDRVVVISTIYGRSDTAASAANTFTVYRPVASNGMIMAGAGNGADKAEGLMGTGPLALAAQLVDAALCPLDAGRLTPDVMMAAASIADKGPLPSVPWSMRGIERALTAMSGSGYKDSGKRGGGVVLTSLTATDAPRVFNRMTHEPLYVSGQTSVWRNAAFRRGPPDFWA
ncbi:MAG: chitobiase/beta-hexosaminidase C-terminal domain-containing protein [Deltaproteobacteria bacterium]|nr:chitobiase/beta-hexosaminidase C-terminal domain-containing protein [Deltaproteobacteria bacterium]